MRDVLVYVDDRPSSLTSRLLQRHDIDPVFLRFQEDVKVFPKSHIDGTSHVPVFIHRGVDDEIEARRFTDWCHQHAFSPKFFLNPSEPRQVEAQRFARKLGLPALTEQQTIAVRNKIAMKQTFRQLGFSTAEFASVAESRDVIAFGNRVGWPIVVKPQDGSACRDTHVIANPEAARVHKLQRDRLWMAESYVQFREWEVCALVNNGSVLAAFVSYFPAPPLLATDGEINANISIGSDRIFGVDTRAIVQRLMTGMGIDRGYVHLELFVSEAGDVVLSEVGIRLAGCEIPANHGLAYGFNIFDALIDIHMCRDVSLRLAANRAVGDLLLPARPGTVRFITPLAELLKCTGVIGGALRVTQGDVIKPIRASHICSGFVHVEGDSYHQVEERMRAVLRSFVCLTDPEGVAVA